MTTTASTPTPLWQPPRQLLEHARLKQYTDWLFVKKGLYFRNYDDLWDWSVTDSEHFWESIAHYFDIQFTTPYQYVLQKSDDGSFLGTSWFGGATLNYAEQIFSQQTNSRPALLFAAEKQGLREVSWADLRRQVAALSGFLRAKGVGVGDRVVAVLPNGPEAIAAFLATNAVGAVWSIGSPDFSAISLIDRFKPLEPKVLIAVDGYTYNGRPIDKSEAIAELQQALPTLTATVWVPYLMRTDSAPATRSTRWSATNRLSDGPTVPYALTNATVWADALATSTPDGLLFESVPFAHPIWVLYSSGTMGKPKAIVHSTGGCLLEHIKLLALHQNVQAGERYCWYATTAGMMWNLALSSLLLGATLVLYEGAPAYPSLSRLWELVDRAQVTHFGSGAAYFLTCMRGGLQPSDAHRLTALRTITVADAPLSAEGGQWLYKAVKPDVCLMPMISATDVCSGLAGGNPVMPVYAGEMQCRLLGCKVEAVDEQGKPVRNRPGELVILKPMPSMPVQFWNDPGDVRYRSSYYERSPDIWWHDDWIEITNRTTVISYGRAGATLNRHGIRIGTAQIYSVVEQVPAVVDSLVVGVERPGGHYFMPLFVVLRYGSVLDNNLLEDIKQALLARFDARYVPDDVIQVEQLPYTLSGRKLEVPVRKMLSGTDASLVMSREELRNPLALDVFVRVVNDLTATW